MLILVLTLDGILLFKQSSMMTLLWPEGSVSLRFRIPIYFNLSLMLPRFMAPSRHLDCVIPAYVKRVHPDVDTVYMIGSDGQQDELEMVGLKVVKEATRPPPGMTEDEFRAFEPDPKVTPS